MKTSCGKFICCVKCEGVPPPPAGRQLQGGCLVGEAESTLTVEGNNEEVQPSLSGRNNAIQGDSLLDREQVQGDFLSGGEQIQILGEEEYEYKCMCVTSSENNVENWENFWETTEGGNMDFWNLSEEEWRTRNPQKIRAKKMKQLRQEEWRTKYSKEELEDENRIWRTNEMLEEDIQDFENNMVIVGCDVEALYPSLDYEVCGRIVAEEIMRTSIKFEDLDYLEGARRRTGSRQSVSGKGPLGKKEETRSNGYSRQ